jgi:UPF0755 protein
VRFFLRLIFICIVAAAIYLAWVLLIPYGPSQQTFVQLKPGAGTRSIASSLSSNGIIRSAPAFLVLHLAKGRHSLKAGEYAFDHPASALEVYNRIARGDVYVHAVTVPEGYNIFDIAQELDAQHLCSRNEFLQLARTGTGLIADLDPQARSLEGYLFPDTYRFSRTQTCHDMAAAMVKRFRREADLLGLNSDFHRVVTLASIVEKETAQPQERALIAGVFVNRMAHKIGLATDPSVIYAALLANRWAGVIHQSDLQFDSPYNTYKYVGLPPGPISNPGAISLRAAMNPTPTDYLYFVSNNHGGHNFARTLEEHNRNVAAYRHQNR